MGQNLPQPSAQDIRQQDERRERSGVPHWESSSPAETPPRTGPSTGADLHPFRWSRSALKVWHKLAVTANQPKNHLTASLVLGHKQNARAADYLFGSAPVLSVSSSLTMCLYPSLHLCLVHRVSLSPPIGQSQQRTPPLWAVIRLRLIVGFFSIIAESLAYYIKHRKATVAVIWCHMK